MGKIEEFHERVKTLDKMLPNMTPKEREIKIEHLRDAMGMQPTLDFGENNARD